MSDLNVSSLTIYPIKSASGIQLSHSWVDDYGLSYDRRFVLTDLNGQFITARTQPTLCLITVSITPDGLVLTAPDMPLLEIKYSQFSVQTHQVTVWEDQINAQYCHQIYDKWFSQYLGLDCQLHFFANNSTRYVKNRNNQVAFADGYPLLLISQASLDDLNKRVRYSTIEMKQFRPNIVISGGEPYQEDKWQHIRIGEVEFELTKPCSRCIMTTVNPDSGDKHHKQEPLTTLKQYRQTPDGEVMFGQNLIALNKGKINLDDTVQVIKTSSGIDFRPPNKKPVAAEVIEPQVSAPPKAPKKVNILFDSWNTTHQGNSKETILEQGEAAGLILPYSCRGGMCGRCKIKLDKGEVRELPSDALTDEEKLQGFVLACSSIPKSDVVVSKG